MSEEVVFKPNTAPNRMMEDWMRHRTAVQNENTTLRARVAELEEELRNIADADYTKWADDMNTPSNFVMWAKSRARHTLNLK